MRPDDEKAYGRLLAYIARAIERADVDCSTWSEWDGHHELARFWEAVRHRRRADGDVRVEPRAWTLHDGTPLPLLDAKWAPKCSSGVAIWMDGYLLSDEFVGQLTVHFEALREASARAAAFRAREKLAMERAGLSADFDSITNTLRFWGGDRKALLALVESYLEQRDVDAGEEAGTRPGTV